MKRTTCVLYVAMSFVAVFFSCHKQDMVYDINQNEVVITASIENSKTTNSGLSTLWAVNDELCAIHKGTTHSTYYNDKFTYSSDNSFTGNPQTLYSSNDWYAVYPYNSGYSKPNEITISINPAIEQNGKNSTSHLAGKDFPLFGRKLNVPKGNAFDIKMSHGLSVAKYQITNTMDKSVDISEITFYSKSNISGTFNVDISSDTPIWSETEDVLSTVTLNVSGNTTIQPGETGEFYAGLLPHTISPDSYFSVKVIGTSQSKSFPCYTKKSSSEAIVFNAGHQKPIILQFDDKHQTPIDKLKQTLSFASSSVTWIIGSSYQIGKSYEPQSLTGAMTEVNWSSSNTDVATIESGKIKIISNGTTEITATAEETDTYYQSSASYKLKISDCEVFNIENDFFKAYLDDAAKSYSDENFGSVSVVANYCSNSKKNRKDIPAPIKLSWDNTYSGTKTIQVYSNSEKTELVCESTSTGSSYEIYNLTPGVKYWFNVSINSTTISSGSFEIEGRRRMVKVSDTYAEGRANNCRDLGGLKTVDGKTLNYNMIFRGTNMDAISDQEKDFLLNYLKIKTDIDLRSGYTSKAPSSNTGNYVGYQVFPEDDVHYCHHEYESNYDDLISKSKTKSTFTDIITSVTEGKACYIHCRIGSDRTGYICLLLEAVLGVSLNDCSIEYEISSFSIAGERKRVKGSTDEDRFNKLVLYIRDYQEGKSFKENAEKILLDAGITSQQISDLRNAMIQ